MKSLELGLIVGLHAGVRDELQKVADLGVATCQLSCWAPEILTRELAESVRHASDATGVRVSSFWAGHSRSAVWNFFDGPTTIGLVPREHREQRVDELCRGADFASWIDAPSITTHAGFIYEDPNHPDYPPLVDAIARVARHCQEHRLGFWFETGQETPVVLLRVIEDIRDRHGLTNLGINLDPANLVLYGKANPVDSLDVFGRYVRGVHAKDGLYPTTGRELGKETPLGAGKVDFPRLIASLRELGYDGAVTIEREIKGPEQERDIRHAIDILTPLLS